MPYLIFALLLGVPTAPDMVAFNFNFGFHYGQAITRSTPAEAPPFYLLIETGDKLLAENGDYIEKEHN